MPKGDEILLVQIAYTVFLSIIAIFMKIAYIKMFEKEGNKKWKAILPLYNSYLLYKMSDKLKNFIVILFIGIFCGLGITAILSDMRFDSIYLIVDAVLIFILSLEIFSFIEKKMNFRGIYKYQISIGLVALLLPLMIICRLLRVY